MTPRSVARRDPVAVRTAGEAAPTPSGDGAEGRPARRAELVHCRHERLPSGRPRYCCHQVPTFSKMHAINLYVASLWLRHLYFIWCIWLCMNLHTYHFFVFYCFLLVSYCVSCSFQFRSSSCSARITFNYQKKETSNNSTINIRASSTTTISLFCNGITMDVS